MLLHSGSTLLTPTIEKLGRIGVSRAAGVGVAGWRPVDAAARGGQRVARQIRASGDGARKGGSGGSGYGGIGGNVNVGGAVGGDSGLGGYGGSGTGGTSAVVGGSGGAGGNMGGSVPAAVTKWSAAAMYAGEKRAEAIAVDTMGNIIMAGSAKGSNPNCVSATDARAKPGRVGRLAHQVRRHG